MSGVWLDIDGYAELLDVGRSTIRDLVTARRIHFSRVGRHVRFSPEDREANRAVWAQEPIKTPSAVLVRLPTRSRRSA